MTIFENNRELLDAFRRGEPGAITRVYREHAGSLFGFLRGGFLVVSKGTKYRFQGYREPWKLERAVQEVFMRAFSEKGRLGYDGIRPYKNYLLTIGRNYVVDQLRLKTREFVSLEEFNETGLEFEQHGISAPASTPEQLAQDKQLEQLVNNFVGTLSPPERRIFEHRFVEQKSVEAASRRFGISEYSVKRDEKILRKRFFAWMHKQGYFEEYSADVYGTLLVVLFVVLEMERIQGYRC